MTTRAKEGSKRKKPSNPEEDGFQIELKIHECVTKDKGLVEAEENLTDPRSIAAAKDKKITQLEKEVNSLEKQIMVAEIHANKTEMEATNEAKVCASRSILQARIKIAQEAMDPCFFRSA
ncbi:hypothetical protein Hanom_Chr16g01456571 [Helianthus anomalus]